MPDPAAGLGAILQAIGAALAPSPPRTTRSGRILTDAPPPPISRPPEPEPARLWSAPGRALSLGPQTN